MGLKELQTWLLNEGIRDELCELTKQMVTTEIDNLTTSDSIASIAEIDWPRLLFAGSILAKSDQRAHQEEALRIATGAIILATNQALKDAGAVLLGKLSNFQAINLAEKRDLLIPGLNSRLGISSRIEAQ